jgi:hypothetical protein
MNFVPFLLQSADLRTWFGVAAIGTMIAETLTHESRALFGWC